MELKTCPKCKISKSLDRYHKNKSSRDGLQYHCKDCRSLVDAAEREKIMRMSHEEALRELIQVHKIESRIKVINSVSDNNLLGIR